MQGKRGERDLTECPGLAFPRKSFHIHILRSHPSPKSAFQSPAGLEESETNGGEKKRKGKIVNESPGEAVTGNGDKGIRKRVGSVAGEKKKTWHRTSRAGHHRNEFGLDEQVKKDV